MNKKVDLAVLEELMAPEYVFHDTDGTNYRGLDGARQMIQMLWTSLPDMQMTVDDMIAEGDEVMLRYTARGTHLGEMAGIPPTGKHIDVSGINVARFKEGKQVEVWDRYDELGVLRQIGMAPVVVQEVV